MAKVSLQGITRKFGNVTAIEDITFDIEDRAFWVLVGPSGCGKSTILRTIAGLESITSGKLYIGDRLVNQVPARQRDVAMVFQNYALYPHLTVAENLAFGLKMRNESQSKITTRIEEVAQTLNIEHLLKRKPKQLSGGQQQRVALGRAIARQPQVFLLDEPLSNLDAQLRDDTRAELKRLHDRVGITTVYVTHDQVEAMTLADRVVVLENGKIQQIGSPQAVYAHPANRMVASFLGNPPMNILPATYRDNQLIILNRRSNATRDRELSSNGFQEQKIPVYSAIAHRLQSLREQTFELGIRPEHITVLPPESSSGIILIVDLIEPLGRETLIKASLPHCPLNLNLIATPNWQGSKGDLLKVQFDADKLFLFDSNSGKTIIEGVIGN
ncbi:ABC transporter ATP-binding protein [Myxosarcina sp. GI1(2024)]